MTITNTETTFKGRIVYVGPMSFPSGGAAARRILGNALSLKSAGYEVLIGSGQLPQKQTNYADEFQGISIHSIGERTAEDKPVLIKHLTYALMGKKTVKWLSYLNPKPTAVILYSGDLPYLIRLIPWCRKNSITLICESADWYDPGNMPGGRFSPYRINFEITMRYLHPHVKNIIVVSSFLENYYKLLGCDTICIPPTIDTLTFQTQVKTLKGSLITIGYTGTPSKKDLFDNYLEALLRVDPMGEQFRFNVAGLSDDEILNFPAIKRRNMKELPKLINCIGKVDHTKAIKLIGDSDFSILLRYPKRYAHAGFPTKVVESMAMGTPVICNLTSDLPKYILDGVSGIVCQDHQVKSLVNALSRIKALSSVEYANMGLVARKIAVESFDFRNYVALLDNFIQKTKIS